MEPVAAALSRFDPARRTRLETALAAAAPALDPAWPALVGWATVEIERAAAELASETEPLDADELLGATAALARRAAASPLILLEPSTEGRIAASLARHGEGPAALYVLAPRGSLAAVRERFLRDGVPVSAVAPGPLGAQALVLRGPTAGPHLLVTEGGGPGTIRA